VDPAVQFRETAYVPQEAVGQIARATGGGPDAARPVAVIDMYVGQP